MFAPKGQYLFLGSLAFPPSVSLEGSFRSVPSHSYQGGKPNDPPSDGTIFLPTANKGKENGPAFLTLAEDCTLRGVAVFYLGQDPAATPVAFPLRNQQKIITSSKMRLGQSILRLQ